MQRFMKATSMGYDWFLLIISLPIVSSIDEKKNVNEDAYWLFRLIPILFGYAILVLLGYFLIKCVQSRIKDGNDQHFRRNCFSNLLFRFALGRPEYLLGVELVELEKAGIDKVDDEAEEVNSKQRRESNAFLEDCLFLSLYFMGIQICLVCMGFFQERIVTRGYPIRGGVGPEHFFKDAQFLVFANRLVAFLLSGLYLLITWTRQPVHVPPLYLHSFASLSNIISSWCQYEALKFVSFPTQTVCKASKIVPTMLMGKLLRKQHYSAKEWSTALVLVVGASLFFLSMASPTEEQPKGNPDPLLLDSNFTAPIHSSIHPSSTASGLVLMGGYLLFDAFTPNWQKKLFDQPPRISTSQMMFGVNAFSVLLCLVSLSHQWTLVSSIEFLLSHDGILTDCLFLSLGSAFGQVFIYMTIKRFGPVVLSVLMTIRQIFSIILSSVYFVHPISFQGIFGLLLVFNAIFFDIYNKYRIRRRRR